MKILFELLFSMQANARNEAEEPASPRRKTLETMLEFSCSTIELIAG